MIYYGKTLSSSGPKLTAVHMVKAKEKNSIHPKYRPDIDGLRAIAVLAVLGFHAFPEWVKGGFIGVDIFFVISGYLISTIIIKGLQRDSFSFFEFYSHRIRRIFPALLLVLIACYALGWFTLLAEEYAQLGKHIAAGAGFVSNLVLWKESGYFDASSDVKPLLHLWSLGIEEQFYVVWPLIMWMAWKRRVNFLFVIVIVTISSFFVNIVTINENPIAAFYSPLSRFWELLIGAILACISVGGNHKILRALNGSYVNILALIGVTLITIPIIFLDKKSLFPGWWALFPTIGAALIIASNGAWINKNILSHKLMVWIGLISYPLYLWHWPVLTYLKIDIAESPTVYARGIALMVSLGLAWATYWFVERQFRKNSRLRLKTIMVLFLMIVFGYVGYNLYIREGNGFRLLKLMPEITGLRPNHTLEWRRGVCFIETEGVEHFADDICVEKGKRPMLFLWGDSYAASLYPGFKKAQAEGGFAMSQFTYAACKPELGASYSGSTLCKDSNKHVLSIIQQTKPNYVFLNARWNSGDDLSMLLPTVDELKRAGISNIILMGPAPTWVEGLPRTIFSYYRKEHKTPPLRSMKFNSESVYKLDADFSKFASANKILYVSQLDILCNDEGCLTRTSQDSKDIMSFDGGHYTPQAGRYVVENFLPKILGLSGKK